MFFQAVLAYPRAFTHLRSTLLSSGFDLYGLVAGVAVADINLRLASALGVTFFSSLLLLLKSRWSCSVYWCIYMI